MEKSVWKYQEQIKNIANCPPSDYKPIDMICFRWVFEDKKHRNNFLPIFVINPQRMIDKADIEKCSGYALSFFDSVKNAKKRYLKLYERFENFDQSVGTHIAKTVIKPDDGVASPPNKIGHFNLHEFSETNLAIKSTWLCPAI